MNEITAGGAIFSRLKLLGVDVVFANSGTDFPPIIEGLAEASAKNISLPQAITIPHEHVAMGMAYGYYLISGKPQAVMLHTNVGIANGSAGAINAACEFVPMILMSGKTPVTEGDRFGARTVPIGWGQEMRDQTALVREACKWDYELRFPEQITGILDRAHAIANSTPKGPVYISLPRETLCETIPLDGTTGDILMRPVVGAPNVDNIAQAAQLLANAKNPLVIAQKGSGDSESFEAFGKWAQEWGIGVCSWWATHLAISTEHPCHVGFDPGEALAKADVVLVLDSLAPWWPDKHTPMDGVKVINMGPDPIFSRHPVRNFPSDITIAGENSVTIPALIDAMDKLERKADQIDARLAALNKTSTNLRKKLKQEAASKNTQGITKTWVSKCLGEALGNTPSSVFSELGVILGSLEREDHNSWFQEPHAGGLGWSFPAALGAQMVDPDRVCVATMGDGSYMFANPTACHQIAEALELPVLIIVLNNEEWGTVRASVNGIYPHGYASKANQMPLTGLSPSPDFTMTAAASRAWAKQVTKAEDVPAMLAQALDVVKNEKRQALLEIKILPH